MYKKILLNGYIMGVCIVSQGGNISEEEYERLTGVLSAMPAAPEGFYYMLREDEVWELVKKEDAPTDPEIDDAEAFGIIFGGAE